MSTLRWPLLALAAVFLALAAGCGEDDSPAGSGGTRGNGVDRAFAAEMIPHHEAAVGMASMAAERSRRPEVKQLAQAITRTQSAEIAQLEKVDRRLEQAGVEPGDLGMAAHEMGMGDDAATLRGAKPFDRAFIDMMVPHHQGAIRMARAVIAGGENPELRGLAEAIVSAQAREIDQMNTWRVDWFGSVSPAGGVPPESGGNHAGHGM